ncbi:helix-turn-helix transcriptional regulator [Lysinibacillus sp. FSL K6-3209]|uniref:helix-turn-helix transcriptional regulator n=1 Tax=Lysinibacillus sp. FSL K6-3209 TaxID=2921497 RepID=UPI0030DA4E6A
MGIGKAIYNERKKIGMKQIYLCKDICTPSYLSKIENETVIPSEEILLLLLKKLGREDLLLITNEDSTIENTEILKNYYKDAILSKNRETTQAIINNLKENEAHYIQTNYYLYSLICLRLAIMQHNSVNHNLYTQLNLLQKDKEKMDDYSIFLLNLVEVIFYYHHSEIYKAIEIVEKMSRDMTLFKDVEEWEIADYYYIQAIVYAKNKQYVLSLQSIKKTINFFSHNLYIKNLIDCYILLGVIYKNNSSYQKAADTYQIALDYCLQNNYVEKTGIIYHNLASLYRKQENYEQSINCYKESIVSKSELFDITFSMVDLIELFIRLKMKSEVINWTCKGINLIDDSNFKSENKYYYIFNLYFQFYSGDKKWEKTGELLLNYLKENGEDEEFNKYSYILAECYYKIKKYKKACDLYRKNNLEVIL